MMADVLAPSLKLGIWKSPARMKAVSAMRGRPMQARVVLPYLSVQSSVTRLKVKFIVPKRSASSTDLSSGIPASSKELEKNAWKVCEQHF
jgi:hypothetical protein